VPGSSTTKRLQVGWQFVQGLSKVKQSSAYFAVLQAKAAYFVDLHYFTKLFLQQPVIK
jgi:hypothetical protein